MGILYLDEAGNTGLRDLSQPFLIYGGPYVCADEWKYLSDELARIQAKYKSMIMGRFQSGIRPNSNFSIIESGVTFLSDFHFHAKDIANNHALWSKLKRDERFQVLDDVIESLLKYKITFFLGFLDKEKYKSKIKQDRKKIRKMQEYRYLLRNFFYFIECEVDKNANIITIVDDGDVGENDVIRDSIRDDNLSNFFGELICGKHYDFPLLQVADIGVWIFQAYHRLDASRNDYHAKQVRSLYGKLEKVIKITEH